LQVGLAYFECHLERMNYRALLDRNLPIGSGVIEGTCRSLVSDRMKHAGMRWRHEGGQAVLTLRALIHSDQFDQAWQMLRATWKADVEEVQQQAA
jgi:hypothetical protein